MCLAQGPQRSDAGEARTRIVSMVAKLKKRDRLNLTLMTLDWKPCQLVKIWLMTVRSEHCHYGVVSMVAKLKKRQSKPNPNDARLKTLSVGPKMVNDSSFRALLHARRVYGSQI